MELKENLGTMVADPEAGMATAEYAIATIAAVGFAGLLIAILTSGSTKSLLNGIVEKALSIPLGSGA